MATLLLCVIFAAAFVPGQTQDGTVLRTNIADMSDRDLVELLVKSVTHLETERVNQQERIEAVEDKLLKQHEITSEIETERVKQQERIDALEDTTLKQNVVITKLETERVKQQEQIDVLKDTVLKQREAIADLQKALEKCDHGKYQKSGKVDANGETEHAKFYKAALKQRRDVRQQRNIRSVVRQVPSTPVAFSAVVGPNNLLHLGAHQNLIFDEANVNTNNVYNPHHGVFTAPMSGVYVITSTVLSDQNREVWCDITVNGAAKAHIYARGTDNRHDQGSQTILLHLKRGDDVTIQNEAADDAVYGYHYTSFSGFLLYEEEPTVIVG